MDYGSACSFSISPKNTSMITVPAGAMSLGVTYAFTVFVAALDGRHASQTVSVSATFSGSAQLSITSSFIRFNPSLKLVLNSTLSATYAVTSTWSVSTAYNVSFPITSLTSQSKSFTIGDAKSQVSFPLSVDSGIFTGGNAYTFRLTVYPTTDKKIKTFTEIILTANAAPTSGYLLSSPTNGSALLTQFLLLSPGWTADAANFPLSFAFSYRLSPLSTYLTLAASSLRPYCSTTLPAGLSTSGGNLTLLAQVTDIFHSLGTATTTVKVTLKKYTNVSDILITSLKAASNTGDFNLAIQTVNNVSLICCSYLCRSTFSDLNL